MKFSILLALALSYTTLSSAQGQNFRPANADKAEQLTKEFAKLTKDSPCENNAQACVEDQFAQCVGGKFQLNSCGGGELKCVVLPLVNKPGTSITCSTEADRLARLADAHGGNGDGNNLKTPPANGDGNLADIRKQNAADAKALQKKFDALKPDDKCNDNDVACVDNKFAQCSGGKFALSDCASGTICAALPLVLKKGTTVACTTEADRDARLKQSETNTK
ncbi:hypothetical protein C1646_654001 [Rhizophagus diaphanus]|nr:hypothetical protein C1646_654001 [Rhizophagus diaphanus] [Rhizophagus sp. MUCL 43196]